MKYLRYISVICISVLTAAPASVYSAISAKDKLEVDSILSHLAEVHGRQSEPIVVNKESLREIANVPSGSDRETLLLVLHNVEGVCGVTTAGEKIVRQSTVLQKQLDSRTVLREYLEFSSSEYDDALLYLALTEKHLYESQLSEIIRQLAVSEDPYRGAKMISEIDSNAKAIATRLVMKAQSLGGISHLVPDSMSEEEFIQSQLESMGVDKGKVSINTNIDLMVNGAVSGIKRSIISALRLSKNEALIPIVTEYVAETGSSKSVSISAERTLSDILN